MSNFSFVQDNVLRSNLDCAFEHIIDLLTLSESELYKEKKTGVSSLRKTIIILTASIVEALLLWKIKVKHSNGQISLPVEWKYIFIKTLHKINPTAEIVGCTRKKIKKEIDGLDFVHIIKLCKDSGVISSQDLLKEIDDVRKLRNRLHIGGLVEVEREYTRSELEFCFGAAHKVKTLVAEK